MQNWILNPFLSSFPVRCFLQWNVLFAFLISFNHKQGRHHNCSYCRVPPHTLLSWFWISIVPSTGGLPRPQMSNYMVCPILRGAIPFPVKFHRNLNSYSAITHFLLNYITTERKFHYYERVLLDLTVSLKFLEVSANFT